MTLMIASSLATLLFALLANSAAAAPSTTVDNTVYNYKVVRGPATLRKPFNEGACGGAWFEVQAIEGIVNVGSFVVGCNYAKYFCYKFQGKYDQLGAPFVTQTGIFLNWNNTLSCVRYAPGQSAHRFTGTFKGRVTIDPKQREPGVDKTDFSDICYTQVDPSTGETVKTCPGFVFNEEVYRGVTGTAVLSFGGVDYEMDVTPIAFVFDSRTVTRTQVLPQ